MSKIRFYSHESLEAMRQQTDPLADQAVATLFSSGDTSQWRKMVSELQLNSDPLPQGLPEAVSHFFQVSSGLPEWADVRKMEQGAVFFSRYGADLMMMLGLLSLPYDYAAAKGAQVLYLSERLHYNPGKRLMETGQYILDVTAPHAFTSRGKAIRSAQKVRLMHAAIRYHIGQGHHWQADWGQPINQEDMAGTNLSIALIPIRGLRKLNLRIAPADALAYLHLWNVVSYLMGVDEKLLPDTAKEAYVLEKAIRTRQHAPSQAGKSLTSALLSYMTQQTDPRFAQLAPVYMRYLLGDPLADCLEVPDATFPPAWLMRSVKGLNSLRNWWPASEKGYYQIWDQLQKQTRAFKKMAEKNFSLPEKLSPSVRSVS